jgi:hypothetical protein
MTNRSGWPVDARAVTVLRAPFPPAAERMLCLLAAGALQMSQLFVRSKHDFVACSLKRMAHGALALANVASDER